MEDTIVVNGVEYIRKDSVEVEAVNKEGLPYVIVRTNSAGVFAGYLKERNGKEGILVNARRLWYWEGAATLSQLAMEGVKKPEKCKFPCPVKEILLPEIIEVIKATSAAQKSIAEVKIWQV